LFIIRTSFNYQEPPPVPAPEDSAVTYCNQFSGSDRVYCLSQVILKLEGLLQDQNDRAQALLNELYDEQAQRFPTGQFLIILVTIFTFTMALRILCLRKKCKRFSTVETNVAEEEVEEDEFKQKEKECPISTTTTETNKPQVENNLKAEYSDIIYQPPSFPSPPTTGGFYIFGPDVPVVYTQLVSPQDQH